MSFYSASSEQVICIQKHEGEANNLATVLTATLPGIHATLQNFARKGEMLDWVLDVTITARLDVHSQKKPRGKVIALNMHDTATRALEFLANEQIVPVFEGEAAEDQTRSAVEWFFEGQKQQQQQMQQQTTDGDDTSYQSTIASSASSAASYTTIPNNYSVCANGTSVPFSPVQLPLDSFVYQQQQQQQQIHAIYQQQQQQQQLGYLQQQLPQMAFPLRAQVDVTNSVGARMLRIDASQNVENVDEEEVVVPVADLQEADHVSEANQNQDDSADKQATPIEEVEQVEEEEEEEECPFQTRIGTVMTLADEPAEERVSTMISYQITGEKDFGAYPERLNEDFCSRCGDKTHSARMHDDRANAVTRNPRLKMCSVNTHNHDGGVVCLKSHTPAELSAANHLALNSKWLDNPKTFCFLTCPSRKYPKTHKNPMGCFGKHEFSACKHNQKKSASYLARGSQDKSQRSKRGGQN